MPTQTLGSSDQARTVAAACLLAVASAWTLALLVAQYDAVPALGAVVLAIGAATVLARPELSALAAVFVLYSNVAIVFSSTPLYPTGFALLSAVLLVRPLAHEIVVRRQHLVGDQVLALMTAFLAVQLVSATGARDIDIAMERVWGYVSEGLLLYLLVLNVARSREMLRGMLWTIVLTCALLSTLSIYQSATGDYTNQFGGLASRSLRLVIAAEEEPDDMAEPVAPAGAVATADRAEGPVGDGNRYAQMLLMALPMAVFLHSRRTAPVARMVAGAAALLILSGLALTYSRGAFLALIPILGFAVMWRYTTAARVLVAALILAVVVSAVAPSYPARIATILHSLALHQDEATVQPDGAIRGRATEMLAALAVFLDYPVLGVGPGQYVPFYSVPYQRLDEVRFRTLHQPRQAHNLVLAIGAETGVLGLGVFLAIVGVLLGRLRAAREYWAVRDPDLSRMTGALFMSVLAYLGTGVFLHLAFERYLWFILGLAGAAVRVAWLEAAATRR
jgi:putative inorganic carbon (hco3(-)) transporter